ncbi:trans-aconitate 2-methyltransferase [Synechococcus sp. UW140]|uniref:class I SAM-dependent methyltransferase n=1 Tax=Synechococcus sp. UW140 TaxID=368503 RepID=UPI001FCA5A6F|nr:class I SAM-dependent methyltransferase [Synechococcus sp. UW140]
MEAPHQVEAYASADFSASDAALLERFAGLCNQHACHAGREQVLIDLGCGPGNISERLAQAFPGSTVIGVDASSPMLAMARQRQASAMPPMGHVSYLQATLAQLVSPTTDSKPLPLGAASAVVSNSLLHHLHQPAQLWQATLRLAAPGALVLHRDLRRPDDPGAALALQDLHLGAAPEVLRRDYLASLHAAFTMTEVRQQLNDAGLHCLEVVEVNDRYLDVIGRLP